MGVGNVTSPETRLRPGVSVSGRSRLRARPTLRGHMGRAGGQPPAMRWAGRHSSCSATGAERGEMTGHRDAALLRPSKLVYSPSDSGFVGWDFVNGYLATGYDFPLGWDGTVVPGPDLTGSPRGDRPGNCSETQRPGSLQICAADGPGVVTVRRSETSAMSGQCFNRGRGPWGPR